MTIAMLGCGAASTRLAGSMRPVLSVLAMLLMSGCSLTQPATIKEMFLVQTREVPAPTARPRPGTLKVGLFGVAAPFEGKGLVYRASDITYTSDFYNEYFVPPGAMIGERVAGHIAQTRPFETIVAGSRLTARYELRGVVTEMYGDLRDKSRPAAVLAIHFYLLRTDAPLDVVLFDRLLQQRVDLHDASAPALVNGLGAALDDLLTGLDQELTQLVVTVEERGVGEAEPR